MGKHDIRTAQTQADELINMIINDPILISSLLRYRSENEFSNPRDIPDLLKVQSLIASSSSTIPHWQADSSYDEKTLVIHTDGGVQYIYESLIDGNTSEPSLSSTTWSIIGGGVQNAYAGPNAPAISLGNNGDFYFIVPNDSSFIEFRQKVNGAWVAIFTVPLVTTSITTITKNQSDLVDDTFGGYYLKLDLPSGKEISTISIKSGTTTSRIDPSLAITDTSLTPNTTISGFANNATQTITIKLL